MVTLNVYYLHISMLEQPVPNRRMADFNRVAFRKKPRSLETVGPEEEGEILENAAKVFS